MFLAIFTGLMNKRAQHILRSVTITFLMAGFVAHLVVPFSSQAQKTAFTRWLNHNVVATGNESELKLRNTIRKLPEQTGDFSILVKEASELVVSHKDHFKIHFSYSGQDENPTKTSWLFEQWNMFQNQKSGFNSVLVESVKALSNWIPQNPDFSFISGNPGVQQHLLKKEIFYHSAIIPGAVIRPLISGISINAP